MEMKDIVLLMIVIVACIAVIGVALYRIINSPTSAHMARIREWLLIAVAEAEREFGSGTGKLKLRYVYDLFLRRFPLVSQIISFELFSSWVDMALAEFEQMLKTNEKLQSYIENK